MDYKENEITNCPLCPRGCPIDSPNCDRGKALAEKLKAGESVDIESLRKEHGHGEHGGQGEHSFDGHGHGEYIRDRESLEGLLRECGHELHHKGNKNSERFNALSQEEQDTLKSLLKKLIESWN